MTDKTVVLVWDAHNPQLFKTGSTFSIYCFRASVEEGVWADGSLFHVRARGNHKPRNIEIREGKAVDVDSGETYTQSHYGAAYWVWATP